MNQLKIIVEPNQHGHVDPGTVRVVAFDPKRKVEVELQTVTGLRLESIIEGGRHRFVAQLVVFDPAIDLKLPVEQIDVVGDRNYALKQEGGDELARHLQDELTRARLEIENTERALEMAIADREAAVKLAEESSKLVGRVKELEESDGRQAARIKELEAVAAKIETKASTGSGKKS